MFYDCFINCFKMLYNCFIFVLYLLKYTFTSSVRHRENPPHRRTQPWSRPLGSPSRRPPSICNAYKYYNSVATFLRFEVRVKGLVNGCLVALNNGGDLDRKFEHILHTADNVRLA